jgi:hypothetical protein
VTTGSERYSRNEGLFGVEGQQDIAATPVMIVGLGGLGSHVSQQLAYLGSVAFTLIDDDIVTDSSMNRVVTADNQDVELETLKVDAAWRRILAVNPAAEIERVPYRLDHPDAVEAFANSGGVVFGCLDDDLARLQLTRLCSTFALPLFDLATDVDPEPTPPIFGGRVVLCNGNGCLVCLGVLDQAALARASMTAEEQRAHDEIYGIRRDALEGTGPMVVSINGTVASLAITEFIAFSTGLRPVNQHLSYYGHLTQIRLSADLPAEDCYYCSAIWGSRSE